MSEKKKEKSSKDEKNNSNKQLEQLKEGKKSSKLSKSEIDEEASNLDIEIGPESFKVISLLGVGSQGRVYLVQLNGTKNYYAMKVFKKDKIINNEKTTRSILTEHRFLATSQHPFITQLLYSFHSAERLFMVMEFCAGGELYTLIKNQPNGRLTDDQVRFYGSEVLLVLEFVHSKGYIYRDLKPENILIHADGHIRMADFGLSKQSDGPIQINIVERKEKKLFGKSKTTVDVQIGEVLRTNSLVGSVHYLAPEVLINPPNEGYNVMADWWAFGVLLYDMFFGYPPFQGTTNEEIIMKIVNGEYSFPSDVSISSQLKSLIKSLLKVDPKKRFCNKHGASDIKNHPFFEGTNWGLLRHRTPPLVPNVSGPCDTSNFIVYDEDQDSIEFQFFSEIKEDPNAIAEEFKDKFESFCFKSITFEKTLENRNGGGLKASQRCASEEIVIEKKKEGKKGKLKNSQSSATQSSPDVIQITEKDNNEPENENKREAGNKNKNNHDDSKEEKKEANENAKLDSAKKSKSNLRKKD